MSIKIVDNLLDADFILIYLSLSRNNGSLHVFEK